MKKLKMGSPAHLALGDWEAVDRFFLYFASRHKLGKGPGRSCTNDSPLLPSERTILKVRIKHADGNTEGL